MRTKIAALLIALLAVSLPLLATSPADAKPKKPSASLSFVTPRIDVSDKPVIKYKTKHLPDGAKAQLQRLTGSSWLKVKNLRSKRGQITGKRLPSLGAYKYRIQVKSKDGKTLVTSKTKELKVYGLVGLDTLLNASTNTVTIGGREFRYAWQGQVQSDDWCCGQTTRSVMSRDNSSCRWIAFSGGLGSVDGAPTVAVQVTQEAADPVSWTVPAGVVSDSGQIALAPGAFKIIGAEVAGSGYARLYLHGIASCFTADGAA